MPKPRKVKYIEAMAVGTVPMTDHPDQKKWFYYGCETVVLMKRFNSTAEHDPAWLALLHEILPRCETEARGWLAMVPPDYAGAAKQWISIESYRFAAGYDKAAVEEAMDTVDDYIRLSGPEWYDTLVAVRKYNREQRVLLACCAHCGKYLRKRNFCQKCMLAAYCGKECQQKHWDEGHREVCGKQKKCEECGKVLEKPLRCSRCKAVWYCDTAHQAQHWEKCHKNVCKKA
jgi:hypothetical protein